MPMFIQWIASGFRWEDDRQLIAALAGQLNSVVILGDFLMYFLLQALSEDRVFEVDTNLPIIDMLNEVTRGIYSLQDEEWETETMLDFYMDMASVFGKIIGKPIDQVMNWMAGVGDIEDGEIEKGLKRIAGFSEKTAEESSLDF